MNPSRKTSTRSVADATTRAALLAFFEKYSTFDLTIIQVRQEVSSPTPEVLLALDELIAAGRVHETAPGAFKLRAPEATSSPGSAEGSLRRSGVAPEDTFVDSRMAPPVAPRAAYPPDVRASLLEDWATAFALRAVRTRGIPAKALDRGIRHYIETRVQRERGEIFRHVDGQFVCDDDLLPVGQVAQAHVDKRDEEIAEFRAWAAKHRNKNARAPEPLSLAEAQRIVEAAAIRDTEIRDDAYIEAGRRMPHLLRHELDLIWRFVRFAESAPPATDLSEQDRRRAKRMWEIGHSTLLWAMSIERGNGNDTWKTSGERPITRDGNKQEPKRTTQVTIGELADEIIANFDKSPLMKSAESMQRDEAVAEVKPALSRLLRTAKQFDRKRHEGLPENEEHVSIEAVKDALFDSVAELAARHGKRIAVREKKVLLGEKFPHIESTKWVRIWTARITGAPTNDVKQISENRLKQGPPPKSRYRPQPLRDQAGNTIGYTHVPTPLDLLEMQIDEAVADAAMMTKLKAAAKKREAAERAARAAARKAARKTAGRRRNPAF